MLHLDRELFGDIVLHVSQESGIDAAIIEKDYYVSLLLSEIQKNIPEIIFKGGTSLSKCYSLIDRFSEDIDIGIFEKEKPTVSQRKRLKEQLVVSIEALGFVLDNEDEIRSRRDFNQYIISYPSVFDSSSINQKLIVETSVFIGIYPTECRKADNYIYDYIKKTNLLNMTELHLLYHLMLKYNARNEHLSIRYLLSEIITYQMHRMGIQGISMIFISCLK